MIDTIKTITNINIPIEVFKNLQDSDNNLKVVIRNRFKEDTGEVWFTANINNHALHYMYYNANKFELAIEVSVPKYLYGNNLQMINVRDIDTFFNKLTADIYKLFNIQVDREEWYTQRIDVCFNLNVCDTAYLMEEWLQYLSKQVIPYKPIRNPRTDTSINRMTGVEFTNRSNTSKLNFYDKELQMMQDDHIDKELISDAEGILRIEIKTTKHERKSYSKTHKLVDYLSLEFFQYIIEKYKIESILEGKYTENIEIDFEKEFIMKSRENKELMKIIKDMMGYIQVKNKLDDELQLKQLYSPSTIDRKNERLEILKQLQLEQMEVAPTLNIPEQFIDFDSFQ